MFCISCRRAISQNDLFCSGCGKQLQQSRPLTVTCRSCQASNPDDAIFCWNCGQRLQREESAVDFILPAPPFAGGTQPPAGTVPTVQGTPQAGGAPVVHGTPPAFDAPSVAPGTGHSFSQTPTSATGQPLSQPAASSAGATPSQPPPAPRPPVPTSHGPQSPRAPQPSVNTPQTAPASASRTKNASGGTRASRRILRPRVVAAVACVAAVVVAAATIGSLAVGAFSQPPKSTISSGPPANPTQAPTLVAPTPTDTPIPPTPTNTPIPPTPTKTPIPPTPTPSPTATPIPTTQVPVPTPTQPPTSTPPTFLLIEVQNIYTTDANQNDKTTFSPGDSINYHVDAYNYQGTAVPVDVQFEVFAAGVGNYSYNETIHVDMPAGLSRFYTPQKIPTNASSDEYIVRITITQSDDQRNTDWGEGRFSIG